VLETVDVGKQPIALYELSAGGESLAQLQELAAPLKGARVLHVNATPYGGGVAEILRSEIPLLRDLGLVADWKLIPGSARRSPALPRNSFHEALTPASVVIG
jgi:trehalose synthase